MQRKFSTSVKVFFPTFSKEEVIKKVRKTLKLYFDKLGLEKVVLFGSYAKGNYTIASDVDLLIIFDERKSSENEVYKTLMKSIKFLELNFTLYPKKIIMLQKIQNGEK
ncbi:nucleotidyltransferase domain-containing protein [Candidatus Bathyarchaeota archaeon]|nr:nucleotidyltransferase domain-containing protein [Candidatus Bathyarchaeota archaeon]